MSRDRRSYPSRKYRSKRLTVIPLDPISHKRLRLVFAILLLGLCGLISRMAWLQVLQSSDLYARARALQIHRVQPLGARRTIVDRIGRLVALDEQRFRLWAHPNNFRFPGDHSELVREPAEVAEKISQYIDMSPSKIINIMGDRRSGIRLIEGLDADKAADISALGISGLELTSYLQRVYPQGDLFANVVGFLNLDRIPQAGLEQSLNNTLSREEPVRRLRLTRDGTPLPDDLAPGVFYRDDEHLQLTLDSRLQELSVKALSVAVQEWNAKRGAAIVMDVTSGELLTLASTPSYDSNSYWNYSPSLFREWSVQDLYEPGSTFKPINLALALQEGAIQADGTVIDTGIVNVGGWPIRNYDGGFSGVIDFPTVLQVSSNVGMVNAMRNLAPSRYWDWLHRLGLDVKPETDLPGALAGYLKSKKDFVNQPIEPAVAAFGHGFSLTPLKLAQLHALIANDGYLVRPHITRRLHGEELSKSPILNKSQPLLRSEVTRTVRSWMESVVEAGSGEGVKTDGYRIGGKTGTADKSVNGTYQEGLKICSFVAHLPVEKPRYVVLVVVDEPKGANAFGSTVAVPVAKKIIDGLLVLEKIPPTDG